MVHISRNYIIISTFFLIWLWLTCLICNSFFDFSLSWERPLFDFIVAEHDSNIENIKCNEYDTFVPIDLKKDMVNNAKYIRCACKKFQIAFRNKSCSWYSYYKLPFHRTTLWLEETQWFRIQCNLSLSGTSLSVFYVQQTAHKLILLQRYWKLHYNIGINVLLVFCGIWLCVTLFLKSFNFS